MTPQPRTPQPRDWRRVAEQVRDEKDSSKMMALVIELDRLLENEDGSRKRTGLDPAFVCMSTV
jgi:hypothetical protein